MKSFLRQRIDAAKRNNGSNGIVVNHAERMYAELDQVGYWCLIDVFKAEDFREFLGNSAAFDFYCEYDEFDFNRFEVSWLINLYPHVLERIARNDTVKEHVRTAIANVLREKKIAASDYQQLQNILVTHFC